jgi:hypothetical protein
LNDTTSGKTSYLGQPESVITYHACRQSINPKENEGRDERGNEHASGGRDADEDAVPDESYTACGWNNPRPEEVVFGSSQHQRLISQNADNPSSSYYI